MATDTEQHITSIESRKWIRRIFWAVVLVEVVIALMDVFLNHYKWIPFRPLRRAINITREDSISNFFSSLQSLVVGVVLALIYVRVRIAENAAERRWERRGWAVLSLFFVYMAIDDAIKLHERLGSSFSDWLEESRSSEGLLEAFPSYSWQLVVGPFFVVMGLFVLWFLFKHLKRWPLRLTFLAGMACLALAMGMDLIEGMDDTFPSMAVHNVEHWMKVFEEFFEMLGTTFFLVAFLTKLADETDRVCFEVY